METEEKCSFAEYVNGVTYVVTVKASLDARLSYEDLVKKLITKEVMLIEPEDDAA